MTKMFTIVVAGGSSSRFGSDKLSKSLGNETVLERSVRIALAASDGVVVVTDPSQYQNPNVHCVVAGGKTRTESVANGIAMIPLDVDIIAIHDAARPMVSIELFNRGKELIEAGNAGAIPGVKVTDTIKQINLDDSEIIESLDRDILRAAQTPQVFDAKIIRELYKNHEPNTDDSMLLENAGYKVVVFEGSISNRKITTEEDLEIIRTEISKEKSVAQFRIGTGYDIHPFSKDKNRKLILGGIEIDHIGLEGHSDSDAVAHALTDSLLSAIGAPDLGTLFPANKQENKNADSFEFLKAVIAMVNIAGFQLSNTSIIINAQEPKLAPHLEAMKQKLWDVLIPISNNSTQISITPKHGEGIGEIGRAEAIAVYTTVLLTASAS